LSRQRLDATVEHIAKNIMGEDTRECPMCGSTMQLKQATSVARIPGYTDTQPRATLEWVCPDCDYFEEADGENK
jgi:rubredoxin